MPESGAGAKFRSTGFQEQPVILTIQSKAINPVPKRSFKRIFLSLGAPWAKRSSASRLLLRNLFQKESFWAKGPGALDRCGLKPITNPGLGDAAALVFLQCSADRQHWTAGAQRWISGSSVLLLDVRGQEQILHPSDLGYLCISCTGQLFIWHFECFMYVSVRGKFSPCWEDKACFYPPALWDLSLSFPLVRIPFKGLILGAVSPTLSSSIFKNGDLQKPLRELRGRSSHWNSKAVNESSQDVRKSQPKFLNYFFFSCLGNCFHHQKKKKKIFGLKAIVLAFHSLPLVLYYTQKCKFLSTNLDYRQISLLKSHSSYFR